MLDFIRFSWQKIKKKFNKLFPCLLAVFLMYNTSFSTYAADIDFTNYITFVENNDPNSAGWISGTTSTNGNINMNIDVIVSDKTVSFVSPGGSTGYNAALFIPYVEIAAGDIIQFDIDSTVVSNFIGYGIKDNYDSTGLVTYSHNYVTSNVAVSYGSLTNFTGSRTITFTSNQSGFFFLYGRVRANAVLDCTFSNISVNGSSVGNFTTEEILNGGNNDTPGIVEQFQSNLEDFNSMVDNFDSIESGFINDFTSANDSIKNQLSDYTFSGNLLSCANWVTDTYMDFFNVSGDFKQYFIYPLIIGICLFFIGRGGVVLGNLYRKPVESTTVTYSDSSGYKRNREGSWSPTGYKGSITTTTYRSGGKLRK